MTAVRPVLTLRYSNALLIWAWIWMVAYGAPNLFYINGALTDVQVPPLYHDRCWLDSDYSSDGPLSLRLQTKTKSCPKTM